MSVEETVELHRIKDSLAQLDTRVAILETEFTHVDRRLETLGDELNRLHKSVDALKHDLHEHNSDMRETLVDHVAREDAGRIKIQKTLIMILLSIVGGMVAVLFDIFRKSNGF